MRGLLDVVPDSPAGPARGSSPRGGGGGGGSGDASFDTNMVIILAALLCALIFALGLNSIARFALRCGRSLAAADASSSSSAAAAAEGGTTGLKRRALRRIPVEVYGRGGRGGGGGGGGGGAGAAEGEGEGAECAICLGEFTDGEKVRVLPTCRHGFHVRCIDTWLAEHSSCPTCRSSLLRIDPRGGVGTAPPQQSGSPSPSPSPVAAAEGR